MEEEIKLLYLLRELPDFSIDMHWDFESSMIPFFSKLAPSGSLNHIDFKTFLF